LLFPAWAFGALAYHATKRWQCSFGGSLALFLISGAALVAALVFENRLGLNNGKAGLPPLYYSSNYFGDNIFGLIVVVHFFCCGLLSKHFASNLEPYRLVRAIRWMAGHTFSLYLYHMPILFFIRAVTKYDTHNALSVLVATTGALVIVAGLSKLTEERYPGLRMWARRWIGIGAEKLKIAFVNWRPSAPKKDAMIGRGLPGALDSFQAGAANDD
jgi:peptidoglycan/LPS O-acetylase OafA/YrhL